MSYVPIATSPDSPLRSQNQPLLENNEPTLAQSLKSLMTTHLYFNSIFIIFFPLGILSSTLNWGSMPTFLLNTFSIIALAKNLDFSTEQLSFKLGQTLSALLNASFGNAVELIIGIMAVYEGLTDVVQASLLGSVLSNLLFVLGFSFFFGGLKFPSQKFNPVAANLDSSLLGFSMIMFLLPYTLKVSLENSPLELSLRDFLQPDKSGVSGKVLMFSRGLAVALLCVYVAFIFFQLYTHAKIFENDEEEEDEDHDILLNTSVSIGSLIVTTILIGFSSEFLVSSIEGLAEDYHLSASFIGLIILPLVGNGAEHVSAVSAAMRNQMNLCIGVCLGSSLQISIFVTPILVLFAALIGVPLTLAFPIFDIAVVFVTIILVTNLINDGNSNWLEGFMLIVTYFIIGFAYFLT